MKQVLSLVILLLDVILLPIWFYIVHTLLVAIHPDRLVWFLFWVYVPLALVIAILASIIKGMKDSK